MFKRRAFSTTFSKTSIFLIGIAVAILGLGIATLVVHFTALPNAGEDTSASSSGAVGGPFALIDTAGKTVTDQTYRGKGMLIYFGYTFCPDACPTALNNLSV